METIKNMLEKIPKKLLIGLGCSLALFAVLYFFVFSGPSAEEAGSIYEDSLQTTGTSDSATSSDQNLNTDRVLHQLNQLREIKISTDLFNSEAFLSLQDFGITINPHPIGRENPFVPTNYVSDGSTIVPRSDPVVPQPINGSESDENNAAEETTTNPSTQNADSATSSPTATTSAEDTTESGSTADDSQSTGS